jgi:hydroxymethylbilane synthase
VKLGTRGSRLALWQAEWVRDRLAERGARVEIVVIKTRGDAEIDRPLHELEGKGFFTKEIEDALLDGRIDFAVHSLKDLPTRLPDGLALGAVPVRASPEDVLVAREAVASLAALPPGARLGTSSLRRVAQAKHVRPDLEVVPLRGNVPTRVRKVREGLDAALLAAAGLDRLGLGEAIAARLDPFEVMPAPAQGALGLEIRADDAATREALRPLEDALSARHVTAERTLLATLEGGCQAPVAAYSGSRAPAEGEGGEGEMRLFGRVTATDGSVQLTASAAYGDRAPATVGEEVARLLLEQGARKLLAR